MALVIPGVGLVDTSGVIPGAGYVELVAGSGATDYALSATSITSGNPVLGTPSIPTGSNNDLAATGIDSQSPALGMPTLTEIVGILGSDIPSTGEHGGSPVLNDFSINPAARYSWEVVTPPTDGVLEIFTDLTFTWDASGVADGDYSWVYRLYENGVSVGTATVAMHAGALVVESIAAGTPTLGTPSLSSYDPGVLIADGIAAGAPVFGTPTLEQQHAMMAVWVATQAPVLGAPALAQHHLIMSSGISAGTPVLGSPILSDGTAIVYAKAPIGCGYPKRKETGVRPQQRNTVRR